MISIFRERLFFASFFMLCFCVRFLSGPNQTTNRKRNCKCNPNCKCNLDRNCNLDCDCNCVLDLSSDLVRLKLSHFQCSMFNFGVTRQMAIAIIAIAISIAITAIAIAICRVTPNLKIEMEKFESFTRLLMSHFSIFHFWKFGNCNCSCVFRFFGLI